ncbi:MAG: phospholipase D-like domain-containing protein [Solirubrobacteraceae bacterium]
MIDRAGPFDWLDRHLGGAVERAAVAHHRRRLAKLGWAHALDPPRDDLTARPRLWCANEPPPRTGNSLELLIDGADALPRIARELAGARDHVHVAGWHVESSFRLERQQPDSPSMREILAMLAERLPVRVLAWAGAPVPAFKPTRKQVRKGRTQLIEGTQIRCTLDSHERPMHCHHEKLVVIDDRVAFVGGIDLTSLGGDRFDSSEHVYRSALGWHDALACIQGPAVRDVAEHFRARWQEVAGESLAPAAASEPAGDVELQILRTLPERVYKFAPRGEFRILEAYIRALRSAERLVYVENQFLWSPELVAILAAKLRDPPTPEFRVLVVLPAKANNGADDTRGQVGVLAEADAGRGRFLACALHARSADGRRSEPIYVHAKIAIVDDRWLTIGSANLNSHSLYNDGEVNIITQDRDLPRELRARLWAEHLEADREEILGADPAQLIDQRGLPIARRHRDRSERGLPLEHRLVELPNVSKRSMRLLGPLQGLLVDG